MTTKDTFQKRVEEEAAAGNLPDIRLARLGEDQWSLLASTAERHGWSYGSGWIWGNRSQHIRLSDSLVKRGLLLKDETRPVYTVAPPVQAIWDECKRVRDAAYAAARRENERDQAEKNYEAKSIRWATAKLIQNNDEEYQQLLALYKQANPFPEK